MHFGRTFAAALAAVFPALSAHANSIVPLGTEAQFQQADAVCRGTVVGFSAYEAEDRLIYTRTLVRVDEVFKGRFPDVVTLVHPGGTVGGRGRAVSSSPALGLGEEHLLFLSQRADGTLYAMQGQHSAPALRRDAVGGAARVTGEPTYAPPDEAMLQRLRNAGPAQGADVTSQTGNTGPGAARTASVVAASHGSVTGFLSAGGLPCRFIQQDRNEPIPYIVDVDVLPAGISQAQALAAVSNACAAWAAVTSLKFQFEGTQSFGDSPGRLDFGDGKLRIQLHDSYNYVPNNGTLALGGYEFDSALLSGWGPGGHVAGHEFFRAVEGFVVIEHTHAFMQNLTTLTEVLCHEVGHTLGLGHSSESPTESNPILEDSIMYYAAHADGRGASLRTYDTPTIRQGYPVNDTPPYSIPRVMRAINVPGGASIPAGAGINEIELRGYDLQNTSLTVATTGEDGLFPGESFALNGSILRFNPVDLDVAPIDPSEENSYFVILYFRHSDGVNRSPYESVRVIDYRRDTRPSGSTDGVPDAWQLQYFGNIDPNIGASAKPGDDFDNDGFTNLQEYRLGTDPTSNTSKLRISSASSTMLQFPARPYEHYEIQSSTTLPAWLIHHPAQLPKTTTGAATFTNSAPRLFLKVIKVQ